MAKKSAKKSNSKPAKKSAAPVKSKTNSKAKAVAKKSATPSKPAKPQAAKSKPANSKAPAPVAKSQNTKAASSSQSKVRSGVPRFIPLDDRIVIERVVAPEKTAGGLFIPDSAQEKPTVGRVVAVGRGHRDAKGRTRPCDVKVGDRVLFTAWSGAEIEVEGSKFVILRETDLLGVTTA